MSYSMQNRPEVLYKQAKVALDSYRPECPEVAIFCYFCIIPFLQVSLNSPLFLYKEYFRYTSYF